MRPRKLYPIFLDMEGRNCVVVGGGRVAERKARGLLDAGARVRVFAGKATDGLSRLARDGRISLLMRAFMFSDIKGAFIIVCATGDERLNRRVAKEARRRKILINVADSPGLCDFFIPAVVRRGLLRIAVSTGGSSPAMARRIREELEVRYGKGYGDFLRAMGALRPKVIEGVPAAKRASVFREMTSEKIVKLFAGGEKAAARREMEKIIKKHQKGE